MRTRRSSLPPILEYVLFGATFTVGAVVLFAKVAAAGGLLF